MEDQDVLMELNSNLEGGGGSFQLNISEIIWCHNPHNYTSLKTSKFCIFLHYPYVHKCQYKYGYFYPTLCIP